MKQSSSNHQSRAGTSKPLNTDSIDRTAEMVLRPSKQPNKKD